MKAMIKLLLLPISLWTACTNPQKKTREFTPGTYVNQAQSEYSIANDTLLVTPDYHVTRRTGYRRITNGKPGPEQHQSKTFTGLWDEQKQTLQLSQNGIIILFNPAGLEVQSNKYRRL